MDTIDQFLLQLGSPVNYHGKPYRIRQLTGNLNTVVLEDPISGRITKAPIAHLSPPTLAADVTPVTTVPLESVSDEHWAIARQRMAIIKPLLISRGDGQLVQALAQQHNISTATLYRWIKLFETTEQLSQLLPNRSNGGEGKTRLTPEVETIVQTTLEEFYLTKDRHSIQFVFDKVEERCVRHGVAVPHINTVSNRVSALREERVLRSRYSHKAADDKYSPHKGKFPGADFPLAVVQIDHTIGDVILVDDQNRMPLGRPWITMAIDVYSRMVVGFYISFETPGALGTGMCVANSLLPKEDWLNRLDVPGEWPCWGKMKKIYVDNAKEFRGSMLKRACEDYGIDLEWRPVRKAHYGGHIERLMGTLAKEIHSLPGTTFSNSKDKGEYPSAKKAALTLGEFEKWLLHFIVNVYHQRIHKSLGQTPLKVFEDGVYQKTGLPARFQDEKKVKLDFLPYFERTIQRYGVELDYIHYQSEVLRSWMHALDEKSPKSNLKRKFIFRRDPRDISVIFFYDPEVKTYVPIPYSDLSMPPITLWEHRHIRNDLVKSGVKNIKQEDLFKRREAMHLIAEQSVVETQRVRREKQLAKTRSNRSKSLKKELGIEIAKSDEVLSEKPQVLQHEKSRVSRHSIQSTDSIQPFEELDYEAFT
jgi:putative transposase